MIDFPRRNGPANWITWEILQTDRIKRAIQQFGKLQAKTIFERNIYPDGKLINTDKFSHRSSLLDARAAKAIEGIQVTSDN